MSAKSDKPCIEYLNMGPWPVYVGFTTSEPAFAKEMKRLGLSDVAFLGRERASATVHTLTHGGEMTFILAMLPAKGRTKEQYAALVAHEAVHIAQGIKEEVSANDHLGRESEAYLVQHIVQWCLQLAWDTGRTKRNAPE
jgi:hypothetical protein